MMAMKVVLILSWNFLPVWEYRCFQISPLIFFFNDFYCLFKAKHRQIELRNESHIWGLSALCCSRAKYYKHHQEIITFSVNETGKNTNVAKSKDRDRKMLRLCFNFKANLQWFCTNLGSSFPSDIPQRCKFSCTKTGFQLSGLSSCALGKRKKKTNCKMSNSELLLIHSVTILGDFHS